MITVFFHVKVKPSREAEFNAIAPRLTASSRQDDGCIEYVFHRRIGSPQEVVLYEQWRDQEALTAHIGRLVTEMGPPDDDPGLPETHVRRRLPKAFVDLFESAEPIRYEPVVDEAITSAVPGGDP
jgi:quinol monooxygenase YgiN